MNLWHVMRTEVRSNLRDRRTLFAAFLFGPLMGPGLFAVVTTLTVNQVSEQADEELEIPIVGHTNAPNLVSFLAQYGVRNSNRFVDRKGLHSAVSAGKEPMGLLVPVNAGPALRKGKPLRIELITDESNSSNRGKQRRLEQILEAYSAYITQQRLTLRGISPILIRPVVIDRVDVSTPSARALALLGMVTYFVLFSALMGCMYLAIDATAGERERGSLEPLLILPVSRSALALGKVASAVCFSLVSVLLSLVGFALSVLVIPFDDLGMSANFGVAEVFRAALIMAPFCVFAASLLNVVGAYTKSTKEAQSYMSVALLVPTLPILFASILGLRSSGWMMLVPALSQHLLITELLKGEHPGALEYLSSAGATAAFAATLAFLLISRFRRG
ncbi:MAG: ABC transporter permease [Myxococcota bacterium]